MANNCADGVYNIDYTDNTLNPIVVNKQTLIQNVLDITLLGQGRKEYGEIFDENILHLLENFSCPEDPINLGNPNLTKTTSNLLEHPTKGQLWYNSTTLRLYVYNGSSWFALSTSSDIGGNSGIIADGMQLPRPISPITGYEFQYSECSWIVSPFNFPSEVDYMVCYSDTTSLTTSQYRLSSSSSIISGYAFYQIIGIKYNNNTGSDVPIVPPLPSSTPRMSSTPAPSVSPTPTPIVGSSVTPTPSITPSSTVPVTPTTTPTPTLSPTSTPAPSATPATSVPILRGTLFISPSLGYPQGTNTALPSPCSTNATTDVNCQYTMSLIVQGLSGGSPPYSVDYSHVNFSASIINTSTSTTVPFAYYYAYTGASGVTTSPLRTGVTSASTLTMSAQFNEVGAQNQVGCGNGSWSQGIVGGSYVTITDSVGRTLNLYTPSGLNGNVYGTSYTTPQSAYIDNYLSAPACGGGGGGGGGCVSINSVFPNGNIAETVELDHMLATCDPYDFFNCGDNAVTYAATRLQPCVRLVTESGASLICSTTAPIPTLENGYMLAPTLANQSVPVMRTNITKWENVVSIEDVGECLVRHITVGDRCFWAGETTDAFILHHNLKKPPSDL
jgi:hypothetical protein